MPPLYKVLDKTLFLVYVKKFTMISQTVQDLSCWQINRQTHQVTNTPTNRH